MRNVVTLTSALLISTALVLTGCGGGSGTQSEQQQSQSFFNKVASYVGSLMGSADSSEPDGIDSADAPMPEGLEPYDVSVDGAADFMPVGDATGVMDVPVEPSDADTL